MGPQSIFRNGGIIVGERRALSPQNDKIFQGDAETNLEIYLFTFLENRLQSSPPPPSPPLRAQPGCVARLADCSLKRLEMSHGEFWQLAIKMEEIGRV